MASTSEKKLTARERARQKVAVQREAQRARDEATEKDLTVILSAGGVRATAQLRREDAIAKARTRFDDAVARADTAFAAAVAKSETEIGGRLAAMKERGQTLGELAELTELSEAEVRRFIKEHRDADEAGGTAVGNSDGSARTSPPGPEAGDVAGGARGAGPEALGESVPHAAAV